MNGVQLENANVGYSLAEPAGGPASAPADRPSFDDHLQQARQQNEPAKHRQQDEPPREPTRQPESAPAAHDLPKQEAHTERPDKEHATATEAPEKEPAGKAAAGENAVAVAAGTIAIACFSGLNLPNESAPAAVDASSVKPDAGQPAETKESGATSAKAASQAAAVKQLGSAIPSAGQPPQAAALVTQTDAIAAPAAQATATASATASAPAPSLVVAAATPPTRNKDSHSGKESPDDVPAMAVSSVPVLDLPSPPQLGDAASLIAAPDDPSDKTHGPSPASAVPQHQEDAPATADNASPPAAENNAAKPPSFALPARTSPHAGGANLSEADRARFVQRVARAFESAGDNGQMRLRLSPPELGSLRLDVSVRHGVLTAHVEAETPQARMLLLDNLPALRERLQEQNIKIERFDVDLMNQSPGGQPQSYRQQRGDAEEPAFTLHSPAAPAEATQERPASIARRLGGGEKLNIVI